MANDRIEYTSDMAWISNEYRLNILENAKPRGIGNGLKVVGNVLMVDALDNVSSGSSLPITSNSIIKELNKIDLLISRI